MSIKPETNVQPAAAQKQTAQVQTQKQPEDPPVTEVYDDSPEAYQIRRQEALDAAAAAPPEGGS